MPRTIILLLITAMLSLQTAFAQGLEDHKNDDGSHTTFRSSEDFLELPATIKTKPQLYTYLLTLASMHEQEKDSNLLHRS